MSIKIIQPQVSVTICDVCGKDSTMLNVNKNCVFKGVVNIPTPVNFNIMLGIDICDNCFNLAKQAILTVSTDTTPMTPVMIMV